MKKDIMVSICSICVSCMMLLGSVYLYVSRLVGPKPILGACSLVTSSCTGIETWLVYLVIMWPLIMGYWFLKLYRYASSGLNTDLHSSNDI
jgi:hypothetical protein